MKLEVITPNSTPNGRGDPARRIDLSVVIPTYNERENVPLFLDALTRTLGDIEWEAIFVDDSSPDGTADVIRDIAVTNPRVRVLERIGRRGLSSACIEGILATAAPYVAVMDADLQHDERILPEMYRLLRQDHCDIVVASRNVEGGSMGNFARYRVWLSRLGARISRAVCRCNVSDAMSGFFVFDRRFFHLVARNLTGTGFKILVDMLATSPRKVRMAEVPYHFRNRQLGESKLDINVGLEYLFLLVDKLIGKFVPTRFALFVLVGSLGVLIHLGVLGLLYHSGLKFVWAQGAATFAAMTFNFFLNNIITFRDRRLKGWRLLTGLLSFYAACSIGAMINVSFAKLLNDHSILWYLAGISGMAISSLWNYGVNTVITWRRSRLATERNAPEVLRDATA